MGGGYLLKSCETLVTEQNIEALSSINAVWVEKAIARTNTKKIVLDMDSSESPVHGSQEGSAYNGHYCSRCYHPLFVFNQFGDCEGAVLRPGNVHSSDGWRNLLEPIINRYKGMNRKLYFRGDAAFAALTFTSTWRRTTSSMPSGFPQIRSSPGK